jgi:hypothetical protein
MDTSESQRENASSSRVRSRDHFGFAYLGCSGLTGRAASLVFVIGLVLTGHANAQDVPSVIAQFTTAVENREPVDQVTFVENDVRKVFFFSDLRGLDGKTVLHRWSHDGQVIAEVPFEVHGARWRVWSSKELRPDWIGEWTVEVVTDEGEVLGAETFTYKPPDT